MGTTNINIRITDGADTESVRKRVSLPASDQVVLDWWDGQLNPSLSVRLLIHEEAKQHGSVDRVNRIGSGAPDIRDAKIASLEAEIAELRRTFGPFMSMLGHTVGAAA